MNDIAEVIARLERIEKKGFKKPSPFLNVKEASEYARQSISTIRRWINSGSLIARRVNGGRLIIHRRDVDALIILESQKPTKSQRQVLNDYAQ
ncbi:MAG: helix-turn-helix domain-containing protein [Bacteroidetes bacterium]|jgi:excisionase family DNA binding protein|nr:helix-turn-helix domain-containing protein [Bacteroidota bacterium]